MGLRGAACLFLAGATGVSAGLVPFPIQELGQKALGFGSARSDFECDLPPVLKPSDGLPSSSDLFTSDEAVETQIGRHQAIIRVPSICYDDLGSFYDDKRWRPFHKLHDVFAETYPILHKKAKVEKINKFGLVYTIEGSDPSLKPALLTGHQDVVPVADEATWTFPPFVGHYDGTYIWGRGAIDDKSCVTGLMSAMETLLANDDFKPKRTILLAFGFDEECSGYRGALPIGEFLEKRYGQDSLSVIFDEGGWGVDERDDVRYAVLSTMEKGHVDIWLELHVVGGHGSIPFPHTGIGIISEMVTALENNPYDAKLTKDSPAYSHMVCLARHSPKEVPGLDQLIKEGDMDKLKDWFVGLGRVPQFAITTSQAVDMIEGGQKINAMPEAISVGVNYRVAAHDSIEKVQHTLVKHVQKVAHKYGIEINAFEDDEEYQTYVRSLGQTDDIALSKDEEIDYQGILNIKAKEKSKATPISPISGRIWDVISGTIQHSYSAVGDKKTVPVTEVMTGNTDTRHYLNLSDHIYRFTPVSTVMHTHIHTIDERIPVSDLMDIVRLYYDLIRNLAAMEDE